MGLGIEYRSRCFAAHWASHLAASRECQDKWLAHLRNSKAWGGLTAKAGGELVVVGAGRLSDLNCTAVVENFSKLHFVDADPLCVGYWQRFAREHPDVEMEFSVCEVTGLVERLTRYLSLIDTADDWGEALSVIDALCTLFDGKEYPLQRMLQRLPGPKTVVSLGILSQLPLMLQDLVEKRLSQRFSAKTTVEHKSAWLRAFQPFGGMVVADHLQQLTSAGILGALIITDLDIVDYRVQGKAWREVEPPVCCEWIEALAGKAGRSFDSDEDTVWRTAEKGVKIAECGVTPALYGVTLDSPRARCEYTPGYSVEVVDEWLWHIKPQYAEEKEFGIVHRVGAFMLSRKE